MKKITLILCLLSAISIRMTYAQPSQAHAAISGENSVSAFADSELSMLPEEPRAGLTDHGQKAVKLTMVASPNPFTSRTAITCYIPVKGKLTLEIRNMFGETVMSTEENVEQEGSHSMDVTSENLKPGIYTAMLRLKTGDNVMMNTIRIVHNK